MQIRPKTYLHLTSLWRLLRNAISPRHERVPAKASPALIFTVIVLALLLAILEINAYRSELQSLGLVAGDQSIPTAFWGP
ncbi:hypothetical protein [Bradyrhizobium sp. USDA 4454]